MNVHDMQVLEADQEAPEADQEAPVHPSAGKSRDLANLIAKLSARRIPEVVNAELTNNCNLKCAKCPTYDASRGRGMMSRELFTKILSDVREGGDAVASLGLSGGGEAVTHPDVIDFVALATEVPNIRGVHIATNGLGLTPKISRDLLAAGLSSLKISLDTNDSLTFLKYNRVDGYDEATENIREFFRIRSETGSQCRAEIKVTLYKPDDEFVAAMREQWGGIADNVRFTGLHNWLGLRGKNSPVRRKTPCVIPWEEIQILWDGQITLCCFDTMEGFMNLGNIADISLSDYWKRYSELAAVRQAHMVLDFENHLVCGHCTVDNYQRDI